MTGSTALAPAAEVAPPTSKPSALVSALPMAGRHLFLILYTIAVLWPVLWVLSMALEPGQDFAFSLSPVPQNPSLDNFVRLVTHTDDQGRWLFGRQLWNSFAIASASALLGIFLSATAAYAFSRAFSAMIFGAGSSPGFHG